MGYTSHKILLTGLPVTGLYSGLKIQHLLNDIFPPKFDVSSPVSTCQTACSKCAPGICVRRHSLDLHTQKLDVLSSALAFQSHSIFRPPAASFGGQLHRGSTWLLPTALPSLKLRFSVEARFTYRVSTALRICISMRIPCKTFWCGFGPFIVRFDSAVPLEE